MPIPSPPCVRPKTVVLSLIIGGLMLLTLGVGAGWAQDSSASLGWKSFGLEGDIAYAPVRLDGYELFSIATALPQEGGESSGIGSLQIRRNRIENRLKSQLQYLLDQNLNSDSLQVTTTKLNQQMAVQAIVEGKPGKPIITVTALDAEIYGLTEADLAEEYARRIQAGLVRGIAERQPEAQWAQAKQALVGGVIATLLVALLYRVQQQLWRSRRQLQKRFADQQQGLMQQQAAFSPDEPLPATITDLKSQLLKLKQQIERKTWQKHILQLAILGISLVGLAWVLQRFPQTRPLGVLLVKQPLGLLLLGLGITLATLGSRLFIDWALAQWVGAEETTPAAQLARRQRRGITLSKIWQDVVTFLWAALGVVLALRLLTLSSGWTLTMQVGVLGVVVSLAFQSTIKDALAGTMLLSRDAYTLGDMVGIKDMVGVVEEMGLCMTQIRNSPGNLITLRNSEITIVANYSRDWARMDFTVWVDHDTDLKQALALMQEVFQSMQASPDWASKLIDQPDILGVEQVDPQGILLRIRTQTKPGQQFGVTREFRYRPQPSI